jgi:hypothetical protein|tara:strand:- start:92 stop:253 length:162 start_codon:yes stop_codon:yes gene_type:complete
MIDGVGNNCDEALINAMKNVGIEHPDKLAGDIDYKLIKELADVVYVQSEIGEA